MRTKLIAKAVVFNTAGKVLLLRRSQTDEQRPGEWDFPGGGIEDGEEIIAGVCREILEESGIIVPMTDIKLFYTATTDYHDVNAVRLVFYTHLKQDADVTLSFEHDDFKWVETGQVSTEFNHPVYGHSVDYGLEHGLFQSGI
jgi:8-oxo-dGTP diphosphatase